jgi:hypothetical protein
MADPNIHLSAGKLSLLGSVNQSHRRWSIRRRSGRKLVLAPDCTIDAGGLRDAVAMARAPPEQEAHFRSAAALARNLVHAWEWGHRDRREHGER